MVEISEKWAALSAEEKEVSFSETSQSRNMLIKSSDFQPVFNLFSE